MTETTKVLALHLGLLALLFLLQFLLPPYHHGQLARVMVLASFAIGYNIMFGYAGLLSLGHALFFAAGMYGLGLTMRFWDLPVGPALIVALVLGAAVSAAVGALALRTAGVAFMIVTLMFAQAGYLTVLYFGEWTRGDEGFVIQAAQRTFAGIDLTQPAPRYFMAFGLFAATLMTCLWVVRSPFGKTLIAIRKNEERARMLGYDVQRMKLLAVILSGTVSAAAGALYGLLFGYAGASFAAVQYSILPLLYVLLGGAGTVIGPFLGTLFMFYLIDLSADVTDAYMLIAGVALVLICLFAPTGLAGLVRARLWKGLP